MKRIVLAATVLLALCAFGARGDIAKRGRDAARADIKAGRLVLRTFGFAHAGSPEYAKLLRERLGVEIRSVGGCVVDARIVTETNAYNDVMKAEIAKRFGKNALEKVQAEAMAHR